LSNILRPSEVIQDDYRLVVVTTQDGRTYMGNRVSETAQTLTLRVVGQGDVVVDRSAIRSVEESTASLMPEGLLDTLTDAEVLDLVAFLRGVAS
jgi:putative heme-binding domain-containing protein